MFARVSTCTLPTELPIVKLQYTSAGVEVTNCVRRTCCYEYYIRLMQSGNVIPISGTWRRAPARQRQSCPWAFLSHYLYSVILSCPLCTESLSFSLALFPFLPLFFPPPHSLPFCLSAWSLHRFSQHIRVAGEPVSAAFALCHLQVSRPQLSLRQDG